MQTNRFPWFSALAIAALLGSVGLARAILLPTTWIVDATGAGNFVDIQPAIDAASDGDLILIKAGSYTDFALAKSLTLTGETGVSARNAVISAAPGPVGLADLDLWSLEVLGCTDAVVCDGVVVDFASVSTASGFFTVNLEDSADVRMIDSIVRGKDGGSPGSNADRAIRVSNARLELVDCVVLGGEGGPGTCSQTEAGDGSTGIWSEHGSFVHTVETVVRGGDGGDWNGGFCASGYVGSPGSGAYLDDGALLAAGGAFEGGDGQASGAGSCSGGGSGLVGSPSATLFHSGTSFIRGSGGGPCKSGKAIQLANKFKVAPFDPTLVRLNDPIVGPGSSVQLQVTGQPGAFTRLFLGTQPQVAPKANTFLELLLIKQTTISIGALPASGAQTYQLDLTPNSGYVPGMTLYAQAVCNYPGGDQRRTNSVPLVLR